MSNLTIGRLLEAAKKIEGVRKPTIVIVSRWLPSEWDCYEVKEYTDTFGHLHPRTLVVGIRTYSYMRWKFAWFEELERWLKK